MANDSSLPFIQSRRKAHRARIARYALLLAVFAGWTPVLSAQTSFRWKFTPGDTVHYETKQQTTTQAIVKTKPTTAVIEMGMRLSWKVESVDPQGTATVIQTIDQLSASLKVDNLQPVVYDSASKTPPARAAKDFADLGKALIGAKCTMQMNARGEVTSVQPSQELIDALGKPSADKLFANEGLSQLVRQASFVTPQEPLMPGVSWTANETISSPLGQINQSARYTYSGPGEYEGTMVEQFEVSKTMSLKAAKNSVELKESEQSGTVWFDNQAGRLVASKTSQRLVTERPYRELKIRVTTSTTMEVRLVPRQP